jgi:hypothetical protein
VDNNKDLLVNSDTDSLVENVRPRRATPVKTKAGLYTFITINLCYISKDVKVNANAPNKKLIKTVEPLK